MSELAYNINGEGFEPPENATSWRVRRMKPRGAPEVVYGSDGVPLTIAIESDLDELRRNVDSAGRFRLDPVDERGRSIEGAQPAYVMVPHVATHDEEKSVAPAVHGGGTEHVITEAMRLNTELAKSVIDRFPEMMHAAAELLRAADGAGLPARQPRVIDVEEEDDDATDQDEAPTPATSAGFELINSLVAQVVPLIVTSLANKKAPDLGAIFDWRKAVPAKALEQTSAQTSTTPKESTALPTLDAKAMTHFIAIQSALAPDEAALARQVAAELSPAEMRTWINDLSALSVPEAVAKIRTSIGQTSKTGGAS